MRRGLPGDGEDVAALHAEIARLTRVVGLQQTQILQLQQQVREHPGIPRIATEEFVRAVGNALMSADLGDITISGARAEIQASVYIDEGPTISLSFPSAASPASQAHSTVALEFRRQPQPGS